MRKTEVTWIDPKVELPTTEEFGAYPCVMVALTVRGNENIWGFQIRSAELRFFGGDKSRPYWAGSKSENHRPIENDAWYVAYWTPMISQPKVNEGT
jgi:hypothetical protein